MTSKDASGVYNTTLKGLAGGTVYYYRPYADMDGVIHYGPVSSFRTSDDNVVETGDANVAGHVKSKLTIGGGAYSKLELGICFSTSNSTPTVNDDTRTTNYEWSTYFDSVNGSSSNFTKYALELPQSPKGK